MSQQEESLPPMSPKRLAILGGVIGAIIIIVIIITSTSAGKPRVDSLQGKVETATAASIQASLNVYYAQQGYYPSTYDELVESSTEYADSLKDSKTKLKDFEYTRRGDRQAYQITYTNIAGEHITIDGNYSEDYH